MFNLNSPVKTHKTPFEVAEYDNILDKSGSSISSADDDNVHMNGE